MSMPNRVCSAAMYPAASPVRASSWARMVGVCSIDRVTRADRFDYPETAVYFHLGGEKLAARLARQLGVGLRPLPGRGRANRLVVVVGPARL